MITDWEEMSDTPVWAEELLEELGDKATTIDLVHRQAEVKLTARIL